jgi:hypothetical protein
MALGWHWVMSYLTEYRTRIIGSLPSLGRIDCGVGGVFPDLVIDVPTYDRALAIAGLRDAFASVTIQDLAALRDDASVLEFRVAYLEPMVGLLSSSVLAQRAELPRLRRLALAVEAAAKSIRKGCRRASAEYELLWPGARDLGETGVSDNVVFIGHGRSEQWRRLKDFLNDRLHLRWEEFNSIPLAGLSNKERLQQLLESCTFAFLVMTAEDTDGSGALHARENVVHEVGLFQGRMGFDRAIVLLEEGCTEFSNIQGISQLRFPSGKIDAAFEEIRRLLEVRLL